MKHRLLDLFSGIGGFSLGAEANGIPTVAFVEKDPFCQKVLRKHFNNIPIEGDIRTCERRRYESRCGYWGIPMPTILSRRKKKRNR